MRRRPRRASRRRSSEIACSRARSAKKTPSAIQPQHNYEPRRRRRFVLGGHFPLASHYVSLWFTLWRTLSLRQILCFSVYYPPPRLPSYSFVNTQFASSSCAWSTRERGACVHL